MILQAYPPAHGSDSIVYFVYAERFLGFDAPVISDLAPPFYPLFILISFKLLGSIYWLIALQFVMSALLPTFGYFIGRHYHPALGLMIGLLILGDVQVATVYNFTSTEPLYIFLLMLILWIYTRLADDRANVSRGKLSFLIGVLLEFLALTRAIGRYLMVPLVVILLFKRRFQQAGILLAGFITTLALYLLLTLIVFGRIEGFSTSNINVLTIFLVRPEWIEDANGTNSALYLEVLAGCEHNGWFGKLYCLRDELGWDNTQALLGGVFSELLRQRPAEYAGVVWDETINFLILSGQQLGFDPQVPSEVQCSNPEKNIPQELGQFTALQWPAILPDFAPSTLESARQIMRPIVFAFCPPLPANSTARQIVDAIAVRYRSLGRPQPLLWYGTLLVLTLVLPSARRYRVLVLTGLSILFNHAVVSALVLSVQPRYVTVTNPVRAILLSTLGFIVVEAIIKMAQAILARRELRQIM